MFKVYGCILVFLGFVVICFFWEVLEIYVRRRGNVLEGGFLFFSFGKKGLFIEFLK